MRMSEVRQSLGERTDWRGLIALLALLAWPGPAWPDIVILANGGRVEGNVQELGDTIEIQTGKGAKITVPRSEVKKIIRKVPPEEERKERVANLDYQNPEAVFEMAIWCQANGFDDDYETYLKRVLNLDPHHAGARSALYDYRKTSKRLPVNEETEARLKKEFGPGFDVDYTAHFRICHNTDPTFVTHRGKLFEAVYSAFYGFFEKRNFPLLTLQDRLDVILFDQREEFQRYARERSPSLADAAGFYSPLENRVSFANTLNDGEYRSLRQGILDAEKQVASLRKQIRQVQATSISVRLSDGSNRVYTKKGALDVLAAEEKKIRAERLQLQNYYANENAMTTSHECLHQLAFNLGVQTRTGDAPSWVAEGLATFFETVTYAALTEVGKKNRERLDMFRRLVEANQVITIRLLIGDDAFFNPSHPASLAAYAETWGLTHFLLNCYEKEYMKYLQKLRDKKVCEVRNGQLRPLRPPVGPEERLKDFRDSFGKEIPLLEKEWIDYMLKM